MPQLEKAPATQFARPGAHPTLEIQEYIRAALRMAHGPMSRNAILAQLKLWGHGTSNAALNAVLGLLVEDGLAVTGSKGFQWAAPASPSMLETIRRKRA